MTSDATASGSAVPAARRRILFVDDEPRILEGLVRMLRPQRATMEALTAPGGPEALELLAREAVDVVVSDMRMPGMDGAELLTRVRDLHPRVVRIILSGQSDLDTILRATAATHQFLAKPCDPEFLRATVARACALRDLLPGDEYKRLVSRRVHLPADPEAHERLASALEGKGSMQRAATAIAADPAMAAKVLQLVGSSFFGQPRRPVSPAEAAGQIGLDTLKALFRAGTAFVSWGSDSGYPLPERARLARLARDLASGIAGELGADARAAADAAIAAHLHGVGELALASDPNSGCHALVSILDPPDQDQAGPAALGAYLLGLWGLPDPVVDAVAALGRRQPPVTLTARAVQAAVALAASELGLAEAVALPPGLPGERLPGWRAHATALAREA